MNRDAEDPRAGEGEGRGAGREEGQARASPWEWVAGAAGALVVAGTVGYLALQAFTSDSSPPLIEIITDTVVATGAGGYLVEFRAHNRGNSTAAALLVEGELRGDTGSVEKSETVLDYVPAGAHRSAGLYFQHDPRSYTLEIVPKGYDVP